MTSMLVHDTRLEGTAPHLAPNVYRVNGATPLSQALGWISKYASSQDGLDQLLIMCHGLPGAVLDTNTRESAVELGFGLQLCRETLTLANVSATNVLKEKWTPSSCMPVGPRELGQATRILRRMDGDSAVSSPRSPALE